MQPWGYKSVCASLQRWKKTKKQMPFLCAVKLATGHIMRFVVSIFWFVPCVYLVTSPQEAAGPETSTLSIAFVRMPVEFVTRSSTDLGLPFLERRDISCVSPPMWRALWHVVSSLPKPKSSENTFSTANNLRCCFQFLPPCTKPDHLSL